MARIGTEGFSADLRAWAPHVETRVPVYFRLALLLATKLDEDAALRARFDEAWAGRAFTAVYDRPLLALAAMRFDALRDGMHPLARAIAVKHPDLDAVTGTALDAALARPQAWESVRTRAVQTNETSRAVTWLWPAFLAGADHAARPLALADLGCSAGLNLVADLLPAPWGDQDGARLPVARGVRAISRRGWDRNPLDVANPDHEAWLRACLWPGETAREERLDAAIVAMQAARSRRVDLALDAAEADEWSTRLTAWSDALPDGTLVLAWQTVVRDYLPADTRDRHAAAMREWLLHRRGAAVWLELESLAGGDPREGPALVAHVADGTAIRDLVLARCDWHPSTLVVDRAAVAELGRHLAR